VIAAPPVEPGADHDTGTCAFWPPVAVTAVGALDTVDGTTALDEVLSVPGPLVFVARTVNV
jgi:hypothetical protein